MANISVTYTFSNGSTADATEVNTNFQDIIDGTSDGTKDFSISALTCAGALTANGNATLGNATADDITITGRIAADIDPKTASATDLGDATQLWRALYVDNVLASINATGDPSYSFHADTDTGMWSSAANTINFSTGGTERLEIDATSIDATVPINSTGASLDGAVVINESGADVDFRIEGDTETNLLFVDASTDRVGIGTNAPSTIFHLEAAEAVITMRDTSGSSNASTITSTLAGDIHFDADETGGSGGFQFKSGGSTLVYIHAAGELTIGTSSQAHDINVVGTAGLTTGTAWTNTSDERLKDIHGTFDKGLEAIEALEPIIFTYKKDNPLNLKSPGQQIGFTAQNVQKVLPEAVSIRKESKGDYLELNVDPIHWAAINAIKELSAEVKELKRKLAA